MIRILYFLLILMSSVTVLSQSPDAEEKHRPQFHFTPPQKWMNDPNGLVLHKGEYHLFYQHYPENSQWGPMHWGHAVSKDLIHWKHLPIALYPDSLGYIFSGSAVSDINNTSGFGKNGEVPLVAIFTHHNMEGEQQKRKDYQVQSIAYSLDDGKTWTKYEANPVVPNPGITDFRDPKVIWYEAQKKWIMTLATKDRITFYSSHDLKSWNKESEFGEGKGAHGGVWECPDLFPLKVDGKTVWVLIVSINPGGPNRGSATQYFIGEFDGSRFTAADDEIRWLDYGTDNYAGVTFSNTGARKVLMGWMSNWLYAGKVPTEKWRGALTIARELALKKTDGKIYMTSMPVKEFSKSLGKKLSPENTTGLFDLQLKTSADKDFAIILSNEKGEELVLGYEKASDQYYIDRGKSGEIKFDENFPRRITAPRLTKDKNCSIRLIADVASVELFADDGLSVLTAIFFPAETMKKLTVKGINEKDYRLVAVKP